MDPLTISAAISTATAAFGGIKKAFMAGRELDAMTQDLSKWMGAVSDVANIEKRAKNPSLLTKVFYSQSICLLYTSPSPRDRTRSRMPSSA